MNGAAAELTDEEIQIGKEFVNKLKKTDLTQFVDKFQETLEKILSGADVQTTSSSGVEDEVEGLGFFN